MTRVEHLKWAKTRSEAYLTTGDIKGAWGSFCCDMLKHPETARHDFLSIGTILLAAGHLSTLEKMREFIQGFN